MTKAYYSYLYYLSLPLDITLVISLGKENVTLASYSILLIPYCHKLYYKYRGIVLPLLPPVPSLPRKRNLFSPRAFFQPNFVQMFHVFVSAPTYPSPSTIYLSYVILSCCYVIDTLSCHRVIHIFISLYNLNTITFG